MSFTLTLGDPVTEQLDHLEPVILFFIEVDLANSPLCYKSVCQVTYSYQYRRRLTS